MPQSAPLQWFLGFFIFIYFAHLMSSKVWALSVRPKFFFFMPEEVVMLEWNWGSC